MIMVTETDRKIVENLHMSFAPALEALIMADAIPGHDKGGAVCSSERYFIRPGSQSVIAGT